MDNLPLFWRPREDRRALATPSKRRSTPSWKGGQCGSGRSSRSSTATTSLRSSWRSRRGSRAVRATLSRSVAFMNIKVVDGGSERPDTVARALESVDPACEYVAVHDAARPCLSHDLVDAVFAAARQHGAALLAVPVADTIKRVGDDDFIKATVSRDALYLAQTPQVFRRESSAKPMLSVRVSAKS